MPNHCLGINSLELHKPCSRLLTGFVVNFIECISKFSELLQHNHLQLSRRCCIIYYTLQKRFAFTLKNATSWYNQQGDLKMLTSLTANRIYEQLCEADEKLNKYSGRTDFFGFKGLQGASNQVEAINHEIQSLKGPETDNSLMFQRSVSYGRHLVKKAATEIRLVEWEKQQNGTLK